MYSRRRLGGLIGGSIVLTSGCLGFITGEESYSETAAPARAAESTAEETGYRLDAIDEQTVEEDYEIAGETRTVKAGNYVATYEKTLDIPLLEDAELGVFAAISSPAFEIAGQTLNPISEYSNEELVDLLTAEYNDLSVTEEVTVDEISILGQTVDVSKFDATAEFEGEDIDVYLHIGSFQHEDDFLVPIGIYPQEREDEEESNVIALFEDIDHPTDV